MLTGKLQAKKQTNETQLGFITAQDGPLLFQVIWANDLPQVKALFGVSEKLSDKHVSLRDFKIFKNSHPVVALTAMVVLEFSSSCFLSLLSAWKCPPVAGTVLRRFCVLEPSMVTGSEQVFSRYLLSECLQRCQIQLHLVVPRLTFLWNSLITLPLVFIISSCDRNKGIKNCITGDKSHALFFSAKVLIQLLSLYISTVVNFELYELT